MSYVEAGARCPCGKVRYGTRRKAKQAARQVQGQAGKAWRAYRCGEFWHLTTQDASVTAFYRDHPELGS